MAVDTALQAGFVPGRDRPILRLSSWSPPCLSLGYAQPLADIDPAARADSGVDLVRRPTGGRAVLHDRELTYAVIAAADDPVVGGTIGESYRAIAAGLLAGLRTLGVPATLAPGRRDGDAAARRSGACFAAATRHELLWRGRKLVGSAQLRRAGVLLQHGSIPLAPSRIGLTTLLRAPAGGDVTAHLDRVTATVADATGQVLAPPTAAALFAPAFADALGLDLDASGLTDAESAAADELRRCRYATATWTERC